jgi:hypothetical protein
MRLDAAIALVEDREEVDQHQHAHPPGVGHRATAGVVAPARWDERSCPARSSAAPASSRPACLALPPPRAA